MSINLLKNLSFTILSLFLINSTNAQSIGDTQVWIASTIENYQDKSLNNGNTWVYFSNGKIWFVKLKAGGTIQHEMSIKDLNQIIVKPSGDSYIVHLRCKFSTRCCDIVHNKINYDGSVVTDFVEQNSKYGYDIYLNNGLNSDNMNIRLKKAFTHLIGLNGGRVISDTF